MPAAVKTEVLVAQRTLFEMTSEYFTSVEAAWRTALRLQGFLVGDGLEAPAPAGADTEFRGGMMPGGE